MENQSKIGTVMFLNSNAGSKSECVVPFLYCCKDEPLLRLFKANDNPFENNSLIPYDGMRVEVFGLPDHDSGFVVDQIKTI